MSNFLVKQNQVGLLEYDFIKRKISVEDFYIILEWEITSKFLKNYVTSNSFDVIPGAHLGQPQCPACGVGHTWGMSLRERWVIVRLALVKGSPKWAPQGRPREAYRTHPMLYTMLVSLYQVSFYANNCFNSLAILRAYLVPVYSFGETDIFEQVSNPEGSVLRTLQTKLTKWVGFAPPMFHGRGIFNYSVGFLPYRKPISTVGKWYPHNCMVKTYTIMEPVGGLINLLCVNVWTHC